MFNNRAGAKVSKQPSHYPPLAFHLVRLAQLLSCVVVASILLFFIHHLEIEHYTIPWTFILLCTVSLLTIIALFVTSMFYHLRTLSPKVNMFWNIASLSLWALGLALLMWNLSGTLTHKCNVANWSNFAGVMVCRLYKALAAFAAVGFLSTASCLVLDVRTHRMTTRLGTYNNMAEVKYPLGYKENDRSRSVSRGVDDIDAHDPYQQSAPSGDIPQFSDSQFSHGISLPYKVQQSIQVKQFGYSVPSEQTTYDGAGTHLHGGYGNGGGI